MNPLLSSMAEIANTAIENFTKLHDDSKIDSANAESNFFDVMENLIQINHGLLNAIGVGHSCLDELVHTTKKHNLHSKLTGAGGGGCAITFIPPKKKIHVNDAMQDLRLKGWDCFTVTVGVEGAQIIEESDLEVDI